MSETDRDAVERYDVIEHHLSTGLGAEMEQNENGDWVKHDDYLAILAAKETAEAERDAVISDLKSYMQIANHEADRAQSAEAEAAALREKLEVARKGLKTAKAQAKGTPLHPYCRFVITTCTDTLATINQPKEGEDNDG